MILVLLLVLFLIFSSAIAGAKEKERLDAAAKAGPKASVVSEDIPKFCPPHQWFHQEVKDLEGNTVKWRMVCKLCGPLKPLG